ncbi:META domain-containing protein [Parasphingopyxis algicola]|uniref:META domain-containing protein n=1 Tax=Parasphingopyxis algicola TaxID=2026624 RepID=UPI0015A27C20|nr:META domain-containing protein [Parasphingopyxis algicola]QLC26533.1 META domain-containing protein [Parasphingopyxis algicola]
MKTLSKSLSTLAALSLFAAAPVLADHHDGVEEAGDRWAGFRAGGNEPFWSLTIDDARFRFEHMGVFSAEAPRTGPGFTPNGTVFMSRSDEGERRDFIVLVEDRICSDSMSGLPFPKTVRVFVEGLHFAGCGGDTLSLLAGDEWRVTSLGGGTVPESAGQVLRFDARGSLSGSGGCNRFMTSYALDDGLGFGPVASTRRACINPEITRLEDALFATLGAVISFEISEDGVLTLFSENGPVLTAER